MIGPKQDIRRGEEFPGQGERQADGSLFIRTDLPGLPVFQYDAVNDCYFQTDSVMMEVTTDSSFQPPPSIDHDEETGQTDPAEPTEPDDPGTQEPEDPSDPGTTEPTEPEDTRIYGPVHLVQLSRGQIMYDGQQPHARWETSPAYVPAIDCYYRILLTFSYRTEDPADGFKQYAEVLDVGFNGKGVADKEVQLPDLASYLLTFPHMDSAAGVICEYRVLGEEPGDPSMEWPEV